MSSILEKLTLAVASHQAGDLRAAAALYNEVLAISPGQPDALRLLAAIHNETGNSSQALSLLDKAISTSPTDPVLHFSRGNILVDIADKSGAVEAFERAISLDPKYSSARLNLGVLLQQLEDDEGALRQYQEILTYEKGASGALNNVGKVLASLSLKRALSETEITTLLSYKELLQERNPVLESIQGNGTFINLSTLAATFKEQGYQEKFFECLSFIGSLESHDKLEASIQVWACVCQGAMQAALRISVKEDRDIPDCLADVANMFKVRQNEKEYFQCLNYIAASEAKTPFGVATQAWAELSLGYFERALSTASSVLNAMPYRQLSVLLDSKTVEEYKGSLPLLSGRWPAHSSRPIIFAAATADYLDVFAENLIRSVFDKSPGCDVHLHIINPDGRRFHPEERLSEFPQEHLSWTSEETGECTKAVYASRRFLRLPELLLESQRVMVCLDIDSISNNNIGDFVQSKMPFDTLVYDRPNETVINQLIAAGFFVVAPTEVGVRFATFVASYIAYFEKGGEEKWFIDQMAILAAKVWFKDHVSNARIKAVPGRVLDWGKFADDSLIWTAKGEDKDRIPEQVR